MQNRVALLSLLSATALWVHVPLASASDTGYFDDRYTGCEGVRLASAPAAGSATATTEAKWCAVYVLPVVFDGDASAVVNELTSAGGYGKVTITARLLPAYTQLGSWHAVCNGWTCSTYRLDNWNNSEHHETTMGDLLF